jgi:arylsulfatase
MMTKRGRTRSRHAFERVFVPDILRPSKRKLLSCSACSQDAEKTASNSPDKLDRTILPIKEPARQTYKELDVRNAKPPDRFEVKAPGGPPNVVVVLIDDIGFGVSSTFGGPISMASLERIAATGLKYNRFHTTALCSPTRVALLTGYNHHFEVCKVPAP